jgi:hypothetical protein
LSGVYQQAWRTIIADREGFWLLAAEAIDWCCHLWMAPAQQGVKLA